MHETPGSQDPPPAQTSRPRILAIAYNCFPGGGSEPGVGWTWTRILAGFGDVVVMVRPIRGAPVDLQASFEDLPERGHARFVEVELPSWFSRLVDRGHHRAPRLQRLQYIAWQVVALRAARRLQRRERFDLVWHLTFANAWLGSFGHLLGPPFVFGPVGGGVNPPWRLVPGLGAKSVLFEVVRVVLRELAAHLNPLARGSIRRAALILTQNEDTRRWLPAKQRAHAVVFPNAVLEDIPQGRDRQPGPPTALYVGRLISMKGVHLAIQALAELPQWHLLVCGDGREKERLIALAGTVGVSERVQFLGWQDRDEVFRLMRQAADVLVFPSFHDEAGMVVVEAIASGLPVVCLNRGGPPVLGGHAVTAAGPDETIHGLADAIRTSGSLTVDSSAIQDVGEARRRLLIVLRDAGLIGDAPPHH
jgi:glycosyltransferase involved in cell wall biosynthesis